MGYLKIGNNDRLWVLDRRIHQPVDFRWPHNSQRSESPDYLWTCRRRWCNIAFQLGSCHRQEIPLHLDRLELWSTRSFPGYLLESRLRRRQDTYKSAFGPGPLRGRENGSSVIWIYSLCGKLTRTQDLLPILRVNKVVSGTGSMMYCNFRV
jgi:hypothetical protein